MDNFLDYLAFMRIVVGFVSGGAGVFVARRALNIDRYWAAAFFGVAFYSVLGGVLSLARQTGIIESGTPSLHIAFAIGQFVNDTGIILLFLHMLDKRRNGPT